MCLPDRLAPFLPGRLRRGVVTFVALLAAAPAVHAADALNGMKLYQNGPAGGGTACASCHGPTPAANVHGILAAANHPEVISGAFAADKGGMGMLFEGRLTPAEIADLAAYIGNPDVGGAPAAPAASAGSLATPD